MDASMGEQMEWPHNDYWWGVVRVMLRSTDGAGAYPRVIKRLDFLSSETIYSRLNLKLSRFVPEDLNLSIQLNDVPNHA